MSFELFLTSVRLRSEREGDWFPRCNIVPNPLEVELLNEGIGSSKWLDTQTSQRVGNRRRLVMVEGRRYRTVDIKRDLVSNKRETSERQQERHAQFAQRRLQVPSNRHRQRTPQSKLLQMDTLFQALHFVALEVEASIVRRGLSKADTWV